MSKIINGIKYNTIEESILNGEKKINTRAKKVFIEAKKNRITNEKENKKIEKLFIKGTLNFNNINQYV